MRNTTKLITKFNMEKIVKISKRLCTV